MTGDRLSFKLRSGGTVVIDLGQCRLCKSKACLSVCDSQGGPLMLDADQGVPALKWSLDEIERGGCVECLGCELDCELYGLGAVTITLPMAGFEGHLSTLTGPTVLAGVR